MLTLKQAAELLGVSPGTLKKWADSGQIPVVKLPSGYRRFQRPVLERWLTEHGYVSEETER